MCLIINELKPKSKDLSFFNLTKQLLSFIFANKKNNKNKKHENNKRKNNNICNSNSCDIYNLIFIRNN